MISQNKKAFFVKISDSLSNTPVPFARVTYSKTRSIIAGEDGRCVLFYDKSKKKDTIEIIAGGFYSSKKIVEIEKNLIHIKLFPEPIKLTQIEVTSRALKNCFNEKMKKNEAGGFITTDGKRKGAEVATPLFWKERKTAYLKGIGFFVLKNENPDTVFLRLNVYQVMNDKPDSLLISRNVKIFGKEILKDRLWVHFNEITLFYGKKIAVSLECLSENAGLDKFCFSTSGSQEGWVRLAGYSFWKKIRGGSFIFQPLIVCE